MDDDIVLEKTRQEQVERMMHAGLKNLYSSQSQFSFDEFAIITLEGLMLLELKKPRRSGGFWQWQLLEELQVIKNQFFKYKHTSK